MSGISPSTRSLLDAATADIRTRQQIDVAVARKSLDAAKQQGAAALMLLEGATRVGKTGARGGGRLDVVG